MQEQLLAELADKIAQAQDPKSLFVDWRELLGFRIGWANPELAVDLCTRHGLDPAESEVIMMQAHGLTECHLHKTGATTFMALGKQHGFDDPNGGTFFGEFCQNQSEFPLAPESAEAGQIFEVKAGRIHAFYANAGGQLTAIGVVNPKIRQGDRFDVVPFDFVTTDPCVVRLAA